MEEDEIKEKVSAALEALYVEEGQIIGFDIGERTISSCLAWLLKPYFPDHAVHVEYNRHGVYPKEIELPDAEGELTDNKVFPDIIVHVPGTDDHNLLAIEIKKSTSNRSDERDLMKLAKLKQEIGYAHALFIRLKMGNDASHEACILDWV
ncbi:hypothetical protein [Sphingopyxis sp. L1A2A]|uniref:hypothetical protein n=1 Tax=Sphingopyxis sp. L1A2A TaxID=2502247 RepID=UPI001BB122A7|nr:hypothetical protein [Sphingopyxis sp. L1A2A]